MSVQLNADETVCNAGVLCMFNIVNVNDSSKLNEN